jgi:hypothetical protein
MTANIILPDNGQKLPDTSDCAGKSCTDNGAIAPVDANTIAALYVEKDGCYYGLPDVDPWDQERDARLYDGPWPVVAHPPCQRWGKLWAGQPLWIKRTGERKIKGDDGGCFAAALDAVRRYGGVLEHPKDSHAWPHFGLNKPPQEGGWIVADFHGGWTCCVEQGRYGHYARKPTWLYAVGCELPELDWGISEPTFPQWAIDKHGLAWCKRAGELAFMGGGTDSSPRIGTPTAFRDLLIGMARSVSTDNGAIHAPVGNNGGIV